jgi:hypothetical protein
MIADPEVPKTSVKTLLVLMALVAAAWLIAGFALYGLKERGTFGDMFGAVNALFSGLAFAGIIYTILLQRQELELQRRELAETRKELEGQKLQLERQAFENAFFQMLTLHNEIVSSFHYTSTDSGRESRGKDCLSAIKHDLETFLGNPNKGGAMEERYMTYYRGHAQAVLGHYFRNLYQIVKYVKNSDVKNKKFYTNIVRAQLASEELFLLFWNTLSELGVEKFKPLMIEFAFFEHLPQDGSIQSADGTRYGAEAFGESAQWHRYLGRVS